MEELPSAVGVNDQQLVWARRALTLAAVAVIVYALYRAIMPASPGCLRSTPSRGYACDPGQPQHPHFLLWLVVAAAGVAVLVAVRRLLSDDRLEVL